MSFRSRHTTAHRWRLGLVLLVAALLPSVASGQESREERLEKAKQHYEAGSRLYSEGKYEEAIRELKTAYDYTGETILLYNIAKSYDKLGDFDNAIRQFQDYLDLTPNITAADRAEVERTIQDLTRRKLELLPEIIIRSDPRGADIYIDNKEKVRGQTPDKFRLEPGPHKIYLEKKGYEPLAKDFVMPTGKPLILEYELQPLEEYGNIQIVANIIGARVFIDGKNVGITPYSEMPSVKIGFHQVILEKEGFHRWEKRVEVNKGRTTLVQADLVRVQQPSSAPAALGWTSLVLGALGIGGAVVANHFAEQEFNDTDDFRLFHNLELGGYIGGGVLAALGMTLIIYDVVREVPSEETVVTGSLEDAWASRSARPSTPMAPRWGLAYDPSKQALQLSAAFAF